LISLSTVEEHVDTFEGFECQWSNDRQFPTRLGSDIGEHEELASAVRPASGFLNRPRMPIGCIDPIESCIGIGLKNSRHSHADAALSDRLDFASAAGGRNSERSTIREAPRGSYYVWVDWFDALGLGRNVPYDMRNLNDAI
jgi:hypothetical protein